MRLYNFFKLILSKEQAYLYQYEFKKLNQTVILQEMVHVSHENTYKSVNNEIKDFLKNNSNARIYLEGVYGEDEHCLKVNQKLMDLLNIDVKNENTTNTQTLFLKEIYKAVAKVSGWQLQNNDNYLKDIENKYLVKADITYEQMYKNLSTLTIEHKEEKTNVSINNDIINFLQKIKLPGFFAKKAINYTLLKTNKGVNDKDYFKDHAFNQIKPIILEKRNLFLVDLVVNNKDENIFITYGAAHSIGIKQLLQEKGYTCELKKKISFEI